MCALFARIPSIQSYFSLIDLAIKQMGQLYLLTIWWKPGEKRPWFLISLRDKTGVWIPSVLNNPKNANGVKNSFICLFFAPSRTDFPATPAASSSILL
jgi:hypothetical protein